jgi:exonuclease III
MLHNFSFIQKNGIDYIKYEDPDIFCLQETKCSESKLPPEVKVDGYHTYWLSGTVLYFTMLIIFTVVWSSITLTFCYGKDVI